MKSVIIVFMKLLLEISERSLGISDAEVLKRTYTLRKSARAVIVDENNNVSLQWVGKHDYYKLPGGGVEVGESEIDALKREVTEEVGCEISIQHELGITIEYRSSHDLLHISYGYLCNASGGSSEPKYDQREIGDGFRSLWKPLDESLSLMDIHYPVESYARFIVMREKAFLAEAKRVLAL